MVKKYAAILATVLLASCGAQPSFAEVYVTSDIGGSTVTTGSDGTIIISSDVGGDIVTTVSTPDSGQDDSDYDGIPNEDDATPNCAICGN